MNDKYTYIIGKTSGSGGEGTSDYNKLSNKPSINGQTLQGDITIETGGRKQIINLPVNDTTEKGTPDKWKNSIDPEQAADILANYNETVFQAEMNVTGNTHSGNGLYSFVSKVTNVGYTEYTYTSTRYYKTNDDIVYQELHIILEGNQEYLGKYTFKAKEHFKVDDYNKLKNLPSINGQEVKGDITIETGGIKTIEVVNEYDEEIQDMTYYRIHKDVFLPLLNSGEEYEVKAIYSGEFNVDFVYYRPVMQNKPKEPWTEETFLDVWLYQYPANPEVGVAVLRYVGYPREDGYYYPEFHNKSMRPDLPEVVIIEDGALIYENNDNLYYMIRKLKDYSDCLINREERVNITFFETNKTDSPQNVQYYPTAVYTDNNKWQWDIQDGEESTSMVYLEGTDTDGNTITVKLTAHHTADNQWVNTKEYIKGGNVGRKTFYLDIINTTSSEAKMQAAEIAQYAIQNQTTDFVVIGLNNKDNTLTSTEIATNGVNELTINFQWGNGREYITLTANSPTDIDIRRDGVTYATLQDLEAINNILERI